MYEELERLHREGKIPDHIYEAIRKPTAGFDHEGEPPEHGKSPSRPGESGEGSHGLQLAEQPTHEREVEPAAPETNLPEAQTKTEEKIKPSDGLAVAPGTASPSQIEAWRTTLRGNFDAVYPRGRHSLDLVLDDGDHGRMIVALEKDPRRDFYDVKTAMPSRPDQFKNKEPLWERTGTSASSAEANPLLPGAKVASPV